MKLYFNFKDGTQFMVDNLALDRMDEGDGFLTMLRNGLKNNSQINLKDSHGNKSVKRYEDLKSIEITFD